MPARTGLSILLDHCVPRPLRRELHPYAARHASELGWQVLEDDALLAAAEKQFDVLVTTDQNMRHQQNLANYSLGIIVLMARSNRLEDLQPLIPEVLELLETIRPGDLHELKA